MKNLTKFLVPRKLNQPLGQQSFYRWISIVLIVPLLCVVIYLLNWYNQYSSKPKSELSSVEFEEFMSIQKIKSQIEIQLDTSRKEPELDSKTDSIKNILTGLVSKNYLEETAVGNFKTNFTDYIKIIKSIGNEKYGIYSELRGKIRKHCDPEVTQNDSLLSDCDYVKYYLQMRRDEKDFIDRYRNNNEDKINKEKLLNSIKKFKAHALSIIAIVEKKRFSDTVDEYEKGIKDLEALIIKKINLKQKLSNSQDSLKVTMVERLEKNDRNYEYLYVLIYLFVFSTFLIYYLVKKQMSEHEFKKKLDDSGRTMSDYIKESKNMSEVSAKVWSDYKANISDTKDINFIFYEINYNKNELYIVYSSLENATLDQDKERSLDDEKHPSTKCLKENLSTGKSYFEHNDIIKLSGSILENDKRLSQSYLVMSLTDKKRFGLLSLQSERENVFDWRHRLLLKKASKDISSLYEVFSQMDLLENLGREILYSKNDPKVLLLTIFNRISKVIPKIDVIAIGEVNEENDNLLTFFGLDREKPNELLKSEEVRDEFCVPWYCVVNGVSIDTNNRQRFENEKAHNLRFSKEKAIADKKSLVYLPIIINKTAKGVFTIQSKELDVFTIRHINMLKLITVFLSDYLEEKIRISILSDINNSTNTLVKIANQKTLKFADKEKEEIRALVAKSNLKLALDKILYKVQDDSFLIIASRFNNLENKYNEGVLKFDEYSLHKSQISSALLYFID